VIEEKLHYASLQNLIDLLFGFVNIGISSNDPLFVRALTLFETKTNVRYESIKSTSGYSDQYEGCSETSCDVLSNATYAQYAYSFGPNGKITNFGRYKYMFRFLWDPIKFFVFGRIFRRSWNHYHIYDKPNESWEIARLRDALGESKKLE